MAAGKHEETMHLRHRKKGGPWWVLLSLAALWLISSAARAGAQSPPRDQQVAAVETYQGTSVGFTADGHAFRGNPNARLTLVEYSDYLCPFCDLHFRQTLPALLEKYGHTGQVKFVIHEFPLASLHPAAPRGATAAMCVAEQGAIRFWQMHDALFQAQQQWNPLPDSTAFLAELARKPGADVTAYDR